MFVGVDDPQTLEALKEPGLGTHEATKLALKLHAHSTQCACKLASTTRNLEQPSFQLSPTRSGTGCLHPRNSLQRDALHVQLSYYSSRSLKTSGERPHPCSLCMQRQASSCR
eukprot:1154183-Pelagomonas_calceolata.AAC.8